MTQCPHCGSPYDGEVQDGFILNCIASNCMKLFWVSGTQSFFVPNIVEAGQSMGSITKADAHNESSWFLGDNHVFCRLNDDFNLIVHGENVSHRIKNWIAEDERNIEILRFVDNRVAPYGLMCSRLNDEEYPRGNDPFIIHRIDKTPLNFEFDFENDVIEDIVGNEQDPRWQDWKNGFEEGIFNLGMKINGQQLRPQQNQALSWMMSRPSTFTIAALPTGYGKSRIMQVASILLNHGVSSGLNRLGGASGPVVIISPLISLRDDQRDRWDEFNDSLAEGVDQLRCEFLTSTHHRRDEDVLRRLGNGEVDVLCCSPDILINPNSRKNKWLEVFQTMERPISAFIVDEAHVIGDWGASIIPTFQLLPSIKEQLRHRNPDLRVLLLSATISIEEELELINLFSDGQILHPMIEGNSRAFRHRSPRLGLSFDVRTTNEEDDHSGLIRKMSTIYSNRPPRWKYRSNGSPFFVGSGPPMILYTHRKAKAREIKNQLKDSGKNAIEYIGDSGPNHRRAALDKFRENQVGWVVGTSAFGMGVDKDDIWVVGYHGLPDSLKELYQSFGRAARYDEWATLDSRKNGYCIAELSGRSQPFSPQMKLPLTLERIFQLIFSSSSVITDNGYFVLEIKSNIERQWRTDETTATDLDEGITSEFGSHQTAQELSALRRDESFDEFFKKQRRLSSSNRRNNNLILWAISCLQRSDSFEFCGLHPRILYSTKTDEISLVETLKLGGYVSVLEALQNQKRLDGGTPANQSRNIVIKCNFNSITYRTFTEALREGISRLQGRYNRGKNELHEFRQAVLGGNICIRKLFAPCYGDTIENTDSCIEHLQQGEEIMPCNICSESLERGPNPVDIIWSEISHFESLFNLQWPQRPQTSLRLFDRPNANNRIQIDGQNQIRYISGNFNLTQEFIDSQVDLAECALYSYDQMVANIRIEGNVAIVTPETEERLEWDNGDSRAFYISFSEGIANVPWRS
jgi:superfamily II DNA/RNA helicase